jgi:hypothetical protein
MIKLKDLLNDVYTFDVKFPGQSFDSYKLDPKVVLPRLKIDKWLEKHKEEVVKMVHADEWQKLYNQLFAAFPECESADIATYINGCIYDPRGWLYNEPEEIHTGDTLERHYGTKSHYAAVKKWAIKNRNKLLKHADANDYQSFYDMLFKEFPNGDQGKLVHALKLIAVEFRIHYDLSDGSN